MNEIKCPKCQTVFQINEIDYNSIVKQIRDNEFNKEIEDKVRLISDKLEQERIIKEANIKEEKNEIINQQAIKIQKLEDSITSKVKERSYELEKEYNDKIRNLERQIDKLNNDLKIQEINSKNDIEKAISDKEIEITKLNNKIVISNQEMELKEKNIKDNYENKLKLKDEQIAYYKDFKAKQSTKMVGESLEQHCMIEFEKLRPLFENAYFSKDNDIKNGSKGDFIFRDYDEFGNELVSIMFEMKNELDKTATKHKNENFFKELDKDRCEKKCEYAVLVSLLEMDNEYYNTGIVDVSHLYDKMYVIRPQFFIPLITLIRNLSKKSLEYKNELEVLKHQNIDISNFEDNIMKFKEGFDRNYRLASDRFKKAIEEIDKTIEHLQKTKENLLKTDDNLRLANKKADDLTIKKLTYNNPTMKEMFNNLKEKVE